MAHTAVHHASNPSSLPLESFGHQHQNMLIVIDAPGGSDGEGEDPLTWCSAVPAILTMSFHSGYSTALTLFENCGKKREEE